MDEHHILGDSAYRLSHSMQTPFPNPVDEQQRRYNRAHSHGRVISERVNGIIKNTYRVLGCKLRHKPERCAMHIITGICLYNLQRLDLQRQLVNPGQRRDLPGRQGITPRDYRRILADQFFA